MNKKLIAVAVAGACVAPAAMAQTANPVTLYGKVYETFEIVEAKGGTTAQNDNTKRRSRVEDQASRLGVRGTEDLGGGLKAFFQLETAFRADQNNTVPGSTGSAQPFGTRNSGVGLQGAWGSILLGRWDTPFKLATTAVDPFGDVTIGGIKMALNDNSQFDRRDQNVIQYWSPTWSGVAVRLQFQANENKTSSSDPKDYGGSITYTGGPIYAFYTYEQHKDQVGNFGASAATAGKKETGHAIGGSFTWSAFKFGVVGERIKKSDREDQKPWMGTVTWTIGNNQIHYMYERNKGGMLIGATQLDCTAHAIGWQYNFSKRTFFLGQYVRVTNENTASTCGSNTFNAGTPFTISGGQDPRGMSFGISHVFYRTQESAI